MSFLGDINGMQLIVLGALMLVTAFVLRRTSVMSRKSRSRDVLAETRQEMRAAERAGSAVLHGLEVRLHEFSREIEGRMQTRLDALDRLTADADQEIERLRQLIEESRGQMRDRSHDQETAAPVILSATENEDETPSSHRADQASGLAPQDRRMIVLLRRSGFSAVEVCRMIECPLEIVKAVLADEDGDNQAEAA